MILLSSQTFRGIVIKGNIDSGASFTEQKSKATKQNINKNVFLIKITLCPTINHNKSV